MTNPFDQFDDQSGGNPFDAFDAPAKKTPSRVFQPGADIAGAFGGAMNKLTADLKDDFQKTTRKKTLGEAAADALPSLGRTARNAGNLANLALSPLTAATDALVVGPGARALSRVPLFGDVEQNKEMISKSLMGLRPAAGGAPRLPAARIPIPAQAAPADLRAGQVLQRAITRDMQSPADVIAAARANPGAPAFHGGGQNLQGLAEVIAKSPGAGGQIIPKAVRAHQAQATDRVTDNIAAGLGGRNDYFATVEAMQDARRAQAQPILAEAFAAPIGGAVYQAEIAPIMARLPRGALDHAVDIARRDGRAPEELGFITKPVPGGGRVDVQVSNPTLETLHYVKKGIDQSLEQYRNPVTNSLDLTGSPGAQADSRVRSALGRTMREINPKYDEAMRLWGDDSERLRALSLGRDVFSPKFDMQSERMTSQIGEMSQAARDMFRKGVGEAVLAQARSTKGGVGAARQLLKSREFGDRVRLAFPNQKAFDDFMAALDQEVTMQDRNSRVVGGSPTYPLQAARADVEQQALDPLDVLGQVFEGGLDPAGLAGRMTKEAIKAIPRRDRSLIGDPLLNETAARALTDPDVLARVLNARAQEQARRAAIARGRGGLGLRLLPPAVAAGQTRGQ